MYVYMLQVENTQNKSVGQSLCSTTQVTVSSSFQVVHCSNRFCTLIGVNALSFTTYSSATWFSPFCLWIWQIKLETLCLEGLEGNCPRRPHPSSWTQTAKKNPTRRWWRAASDVSAVVWPMTASEQKRWTLADTLCMLYLVYIMYTCIN